MHFLLKAYKGGGIIYHELGSAPGDAGSGGGCHEKLKRSPALYNLGYHAQPLGASVFPGGKFSQQGGH